MKKKQKKSPLAIGITIGIIIGIAVVAALSWYVRSQEPFVANEEQSTSAPLGTEPAREFKADFTIQEGPPPGIETPYSGTLVSYARWIDRDGTHLVILATGDSSTYTSSAQGDRTILEVLHYLKESSEFILKSQSKETIPPLAPGSVGRFYRDMILLRDIDGDGRGEAFVAYSIDESSEPGSKRLELLGFYDDSILTLSGTTRYDPIDTQGIAASMLSSGMADAPLVIRDEALALWADAQFDLSEPPAFPGFYDFQSFDGAVFKGDEPFWSLTILPQYALLKFASDPSPSAIRYESIRSDGPNLIIEGAGQVEAWDHSFRITIEKKQVVAPHGESFDYTATIDWSDGTRLHGWGALAKKDAP